MWEIVLNTIASEFSDLSNVELVTRVIMRLLFAAFLGGLLGYERESRGQAAGLRTHMMVALGAALFVVVPEQGGAMEDAMSRVVQGVIAGIGFLCAGTIIKETSKEEVKGLTTSAGLWLTAAVGVAVGMGNEAIALLATLLALFVLTIIPMVSRRQE